ncbi:hypothetical protein [Ralstonia pseudosolanacearum]|uniref:hypothetical protein n=1 Tax=Ralstonia pseudosolanacearum TaxID=1310165 RepID=UPI001C308B14|nr:hypothetical protein [Ralstonia pseudosolanacearum]
MNPYADQLSFGDHQTRTRRDHAKYLSLIRAIALLHQHQRERRQVEHRGQMLTYIEVTRQDIALANRVAHEVLGRTLDELPPQTRKLLTLLRNWVTEQCRAQGVAQADYRFTRRELREAVHWGDTQLKVHLARLVEMELLAVHRRGLSHAYELAWDGDGERAHLCGLREAEALQDAGGQQYDRDRSGSKALRSASGRGAVGAWSAAGRTSADTPPAQAAQGPTAAAHDTADADVRQKQFRPARAAAVLPSAA